MADFDELFDELRPLLARHESSLVVLRDEPGDLQMQTTKAGPSGTHMWFGAVQTRKRYVSVHLMPVYSHPDLLARVSEPLRARMQGKSCFNFTGRTLTADLETELAALTAAGLGRFRETGLA